MDNEPRGRAASGAGATIDKKLSFWPGLGEFRELFAYDAALSQPGEVFGEPLAGVPEAQQRCAGKIGGGSFGGVWEVTARPGEGEELVRARLGLEAGAALPPLVVKVMWGLGEDAFRSKAEQALREGDGPREGDGGRLQLAHPGISVNIASFVEVLCDGTPNKACLVLRRAMGMGDDRLGPNFGGRNGASEGDFWRVCAVKSGRNEIFSEHAAKAIALQILSAVRVLHHAGYMHRDLKPENLLVYSSKTFMGEPVPELQITDLGTLKFVPDGIRLQDNDGGGGDAAAGALPAAEGAHEPRLQTLSPLHDPKKYIGSDQYVAPELLTLLREQRDSERVRARPEMDKLMGAYGEKVDIWAVGVTVYFVLAGGNKPYGERDRLTIRWQERHCVATEKVRSMAANRLRGGHPPLSDAAKNFLLKAMNVDSDDRWTAEQLMGHPWLRGVLGEFNRVFGPSYLVDAAAVTAAADAAARRDSGLGDEMAGGGGGGGGAGAAAAQAAGGGGGGWGGEGGAQ